MVEQHHRKHSDVVLQTEFVLCAQVAQLRAALRGMPDLERALGAARNAAAAPPTALPPAILTTLQRKCEILLALVASPHPQMLTV